MSLSCSLFGHKWNGCQCVRCGSIQDSGHTWVADSKCKEHCSTCGKLRELHRWNGCRCMHCGETRDQDHNWENCTCKRCGAVRDEHHNWDGCVCKACGKKRDQGHDWENCTCKQCGAVRDEQHVWNGCKCEICRKQRDEEHIWDGCVCKVCKVKKDSDHTFKNCVCKKCGKIDQSPEAKHVYKVTSKSESCHHLYYRPTLRNPLELVCIHCGHCNTISEGTICPKCFDVINVSGEMQGTIEVTSSYCHHCGYTDTYERSDSY